MSIQEVDIKKLVEEILKNKNSKSNDSDQTYPMDQFADPLTFLRTISSIAYSTIEESITMNLAVTIALADISGQIIFSYRMPSAILASQEIAQKKAYTAVAMKSATKDLKEFIQPTADLYQLETISDGKIVTFGGGIPITTKEGRILGGIGISGAPNPEDDHKLANYFLEEFRKSFKL